MAKVSTAASRALYEALKKAGLDFFVTYPCNWTSVLLDLVDHDPDVEHMPVTREEEGIGVAGGAYLGGKKPAVIMQSSGIGNSLNALASLHLTYKIPVLILISHRGIDKEKIVAQRGMGRALTNLLEGVGIRHFSLRDRDSIDEVVGKAFGAAFEREEPVAIILSPFFLLEDI